MKLASASSSITALALALALSTAPSVVEARQRILLFTRTATFRHDSIPTAIEKIIDWGNNSWPYYDVVHTEDQRMFTYQGWLDQFDAIVFVSTSGRILTRNGQRRMIEYIQKGGGFMGVHEASDCVYEPWYNRLVGAQFDYHPEQCHAEMLVQDASHPSVSWIKNGSWWVQDEMYNYLSDPRIYGAQYTLAANESTYNDPVTSIADRERAQGSPHPIAWYKEGNLLNSVDWHVGGNTDDTDRSLPASGGDGRMFYTALGHSNKTWNDVDFKHHFLGGLGWVLNSTTIKSYSYDYSNDENAWRVGQPHEDPAAWVDPFPEPVEPVDSNPDTGSTFTKSKDDAATSSMPLNMAALLAAAVMASAVLCTI